MKIDLSGKSALVTGSTGGIGFALARGLQEAGAQVAEGKSLEEAGAEFVLAHRAHVADPAAVKRGGGREHGGRSRLAAGVRHHRRGPARRWRRRGLHLLNP